MRFVEKGRIFGFGALVVMYFLGMYNVALGADDKRVARQYAEQRWLIPEMSRAGPNLRVRSIEEIPELDSLIAFNGQAFRIAFENTGSGFGGRSSMTFTVIVNKSKARGFEFVEEAVDFLGKNSEPVKTDQEAAGLIEAFGLLMNWKLLPKEKTNGIAMKKEDSSRLVDCAFITDPFLKGLVKIRFRIDPDGKIKIVEKSGQQR